MDQRKLILVQAQIRGRYVRKRVKTIKHRNSVTRELLSTEEYYVQCLKHVLSIYYKPLRESSLSPDPLVSKEELSTLFSNLEVILSLHEVLCEEIKGRISKWSDQSKIGDVLARMFPLLRMYSPYCNNYSFALSTLRQCSERERFAKWLQETEASNQQVKLNLTALLIMPIQRIPRYSLLLNDLLRNTWRSHIDFDDLTTALHLIKEMADKMNEGVRYAENEFKLYTIQSGFVSAKKSSIPTIVQDGRWFVYEGLLQKITERFNQSRTAYLFNDVLVTATRLLPTNYYQVGKVIPIGNAWVRDLSDTADLQNIFQIVCVKRTYTVATRTEEQKREWIKHLCATIDKAVAENPQLMSQRVPVKIESNSTPGLFGFFAVTAIKWDPALQSVPPPVSGSFVPTFTNSITVSAPAPLLSPRGPEARSQTIVESRSPVMQPVEVASIAQESAAPPPIAVQPAVVSTSNMSTTASVEDEGTTTVNKLFRILKQSHRIVKEQEGLPVPDDLPARGRSQAVSKIVPPLLSPRSAVTPSMVDGPTEVSLLEPGVYGAPKLVTRTTLKSVSLKPITIPPPVPMKRSTKSPFDSASPSPSPKVPTLPVVNELPLPKPPMIPLLPPKRTSGSDSPKVFPSAPPSSVLSNISSSPVPSSPLSPSSSPSTMPKLPSLPPKPRTTQDLPKPPITATMSDSSIPVITPPVVLPKKRLSAPVDAPKLSELEAPVRGSQVSEPSVEVVVAESIVPQSRPTPPVRPVAPKPSPSLPTPTNIVPEPSATEVLSQLPVSIVAGDVPSTHVPELSPAIAIQPTSSGKKPVPRPPPVSSEVVQSPSSESAPLSFAERRKLFAAGQK